MNLISHEVKEFDRSCEHTHAFHRGYHQPGTFENWKYVLRKQLKINAGLEIEFREPQDYVCASLQDIKVHWT